MEEVYKQRLSLGRQKRERSKREELTDLEGWDELGESDEEEVEVEEELELFVQDQGKEGCDVVLLVADGVGSERVLELDCIGRGREGGGG